MGEKNMLIKTYRSNEEKYLQTQLKELYKTSDRTMNMKGTNLEFDQAIADENIFKLR
jgi:hypothetical protein